MENGEGEGEKETEERKKIKREKEEEASTLFNHVLYPPLSIYGASAPYSWCINGKWGG